ncbi:hypothetical protein ACES2L_15145 [Bdellovibrio bacteriovorus]
MFKTLLLVALSLIGCTSAMTVTRAPLSIPTEQASATENSIKLDIQNILQSYNTFENNGKTWEAVRISVTDYLTKLWKQGLLKGETSEDAFSVQIGLGSTMTMDDVIDGLMRLSVTVAIKDASEVRVITFQQDLNK